MVATSCKKSTSYICRRHLSGLHCTLPFLSLSTVLVKIMFILQTHLLHVHLAGNRTSQTVTNIKESDSFGTWPSEYILPSSQINVRTSHFIQVSALSIPESSVWQMAAILQCQRILTPIVSSMTLLPSTETIFGLDWCHTRLRIPM